MRAISGQELETARLDPRAVFDQPAEVVSAKALTSVQMREILQKWRDDEIALQRAEGEGMGEGENDMLRRVDEALHALHEQTGIETMLTD